MTKSQKLLENLNSAYCNFHQKYEELFWLFKMGEHGKEKAMNNAQIKFDHFRSDQKNLKAVESLLSDTKTTREDGQRLQIWKNFFKLYQIPKKLIPLRNKIIALESKIAGAMARRKEGYIDPKTKKFNPASKLKIRMMMRTSADEVLRKTCFKALETMAVVEVDDYMKVVRLRNQFAKALGFEDFYAYRLHISEGMTKDQVFSLFAKIYEQTKETFGKIRKLEEKKPGLRKPWNFGFIMSGSFTKEEDPYYQFENALMLWGKSFAALGIDFKGGTLQLDLLDRKGKYNNGFCHYPVTVNFKNGKRNPGAADFTCNVVYGQAGSGFEGMHTLFHEGGHAADRLNAEETESCLNTESPPASIAWAETHSQFLDTVFSSIEWRTRYAKNAKGSSYPFELFERKAKELRLLAPHGLHHIMFVAEFEKVIYETEELTEEKVFKIAREIHRKYFDFSEDSILALGVPHIYDWESSGYYHAYGLAVLALEQWRKYFNDKYGFIVDNPKVGKEMAKVWELASSKTFAEFVKIATGKELSSEAFLEGATMSIEKYLDRAKQRIKRMKTVPEFKGPVKLNAHIRMVHGKETIADNSKSFEDMAEKYKDWLSRQEKHS